MAEKSSSSSSAGIGFAGLLTVAFVVLKLCHVINWSWWWVLAPLWISFLLGISILAIVLAIMVIAALRPQKGYRR